MAKIFVSYGHNRGGMAEKLVKRLEIFGYEVFIDTKIIAGEHFPQRITQSLETSHAVIALWDNTTVDSQAVLDECARADKLKKLIPVLLEPVSLEKIPFQLANIQYIEIFDEDGFDSGDGLDALLRAINRLCDPERFRQELAQEDSGAALRPIKAEAPDSAPVQLLSVVEDMRANQIRVPAYQREENQWDLETKSLFVESIINNLPIPAFFFEPQQENGFTINYVVDGQQRLSVLLSYINDEFALIDSATTPYISEQSTHYRGRKFSELHPVFQNAFRKYQLTIMKVRDLGDQRLEIFRRINRGGTPLSGQDIRLAYYSSSSASVNFIRLVGIRNPSDRSSRRTIENLESSFSLKYPWRKDAARAKWENFWSKGSASIGQRASEMFLWAVLSADLRNAKPFLPKEITGKSSATQQSVLDSALDAYCATLARRDMGSGDVTLATLDEITGQIFPLFEELVQSQFGKAHMVSENADKIALLFGAVYRRGLRAGNSKNQKAWEFIPKFIHQPSAYTKKQKSKKISLGRKWANAGGYLDFMERTEEVVQSVL